MLLSQQADNFLKSRTGQMFIGLIIGDGTLTPYRFEHSQRNTYWEYSQHISQQFQNEYPHLLTPKISKDHFYLKRRVNPESLIIYSSQTFYTKRHSIFKELYTIFYPNGKKILPMNIIEEYFTEISLLYLYLDDGRVGKYARSGLGLDLYNFDEQELIKFQKFLMKRFELEITIQNQNQYKVLYVKIESSKQLLFRFNQLSEIVDSIGLIGQTKLHLKKGIVQTQKLQFLKPRENFNIIHTHQIDSIEKADQLAGVLQGFIVGGANFSWNKNCRTGYLRLYFKAQTPFTDSLLILFNQNKIQIKVTSSSKNLRIGVKVNQPLSPYVKEIIDSQGLIKNVAHTSCIYNNWFWKVLCAYKGRNLHARTQRGGLTIGLNHLSIQNVRNLSDYLNKVYFLKTRLHYRDQQTKASIYIPVQGREKFLKIFEIE